MASVFFQIPSPIDFKGDHSQSYEKPFGRLSSMSDNQLAGRAPQWSFERQSKGASKDSTARIVIIRMRVAGCTSDGELEAESRVEEDSRSLAKWQSISLYWPLFLRKFEENDVALLIPSSPPRISGTQHLLDVNLGGDSIEDGARRRLQSIFGRKASTKMHSRILYDKEWMSLQSFTTENDHLTVLSFLSCKGNYDEVIGQAEEVPIFKLVPSNFFRLGYPSAVYLVEFSLHSIICITHVQWTLAYANNFTEYRGIILIRLSTISNFGPSAPPSLDFVLDLNVRSRPALPSPNPLSKESPAGACSYQLLLWLMFSASAAVSDDKLAFVEEAKEIYADEPKLQLFLFRDKQIGRTAFKLPSAEKWSVRFVDAARSTGLNFGLAGWVNDHGRSPSGLSCPV
ncbi:hypothetical protein EV421DRAFT_1742284 [Armillaria borealis]|uniref:Uncharacterized protein n=1 Tax=Armillaria borealis TaxID=47425 RepID=A0AA39IZG9_9AGAR|nr:hypothetical protein EV421DRAFT_1742284 [Armillaria borealis]